MNSAELKLMSELEQKLRAWKKEYHRGCDLQNKAKNSHAHGVARKVKGIAIQGIIEEIGKFKRDFLREVVF